MKVFERFRRAARRLHEEQESGVAMTEFAIAFPLQFFATLAIMQFALLMVGHVLTEHAAFAAARAALVADVPGEGSTNATQQQMKNQQQAEAKRAACYIVMAVCPSNTEFGSAPPPNAIQFNGGDDSSAAAYKLTNDNIVTTNADDNYVGAYLEFDFPLVIPVVNHWFAKLQGGTPGEFWYGPNTTGGYNAASNAHQFTCYRIFKSAFVPKPWRAQ
jgi:hypothetical protein